MARYLCAVELDRPDRTNFVQVSYAILLTPFLFMFLWEKIKRRFLVGVRYLFIHIYINVGCEALRYPLDFIYQKREQGSRTIPAYIFFPYLLFELFRLSVLYFHFYYPI